MNWEARFAYLREHGCGPELPELLARLERKNVRVELVEGRLNVVARRGVLTAAERTELDVRKHDITAWLAGDKAQGVRRLEPPGGRVASVWRPLPEERRWPAPRPYDPLDHF